MARKRPRWLQELEIIELYKSLFNKPARTEKPTEKPTEPAKDPKHTKKLTKQATLIFFL